jgi:hypothetical protein
MHTHHTQPKSAEPRKRNIPKVSIRHGDAGISALSQKESGDWIKKPSVVNEKVANLRCEQSPIGWRGARPLSRSTRFGMR